MFKTALLKGYGNRERRFPSPPQKNNNYELPRIDTKFLKEKIKCIISPYSGCYHVYLDVGSNVGVQVKICNFQILGEILGIIFESKKVRKLYDPLLFRPAVPAAEHWYSKLFGGPEERDPKEIWQLKIANESVSMYLSHRVF